MNRTIRLGISTCPNDTFAFHGLLEKQVDWRGLDFEVELMDIQELNERIFAGSFDIAKGSYHAALLHSDSLLVLPSGSALGFGVGPLMLSSRPGQKPGEPKLGDSSDRVLCPGDQTTATLLLRMFYPTLQNIEQVVFSDIMPRLCDGSADFGVCIHEGRFTWQDQGLGLVADLGTLWEQQTSCPLPLGGLFADRTLPHDVLWTAQNVIHDSLRFAMAQPALAVPTMRRFAQEFDDDVLMQHVDLYVNDWTVELGKTGAKSLDELSRRAKAAGVIPDSQSSLQILQPSA